MEHHCIDAEMGLEKCPRLQQHLPSQEEDEKQNCPAASSVAGRRVGVRFVTACFLCACAVLATAARRATHSSLRAAKFDFPLVARASFESLSHAKAAVAGGNLDVMGRVLGSSIIVTGGQVKVERTFLLHDEQDWSTLESTSTQGTIEVDEEHTALMKLDESHMQNVLYNDDENEGQRRRLAYETMSFRPCYRTVDATYTTMDDIVTDYPDLASVEIIGQSFKGEPLRVLRLTSPKNNQTKKPPMFVTAGIHAREYAPPEVVTIFATYLVEGYGVDADATWILDHVDIRLLLVSNPDSRRIAEQYDPQYYYSSIPRKNQNRAGCTVSSYGGTDLNRNFNFMWGQDGSSPNPCQQTYRGSSAESEMETQAIATYSRELFPPEQRKANPEKDADDAYDEDTSRGLYVDVHAYGRDMIFPWGYKNDNVGNIDGYKAITHKLSKLNKYEPSGSEYNFLGTTSGDTLDYHYGALGVASILFELGDSWYESCASFEETVLPDNLQALIYSAKLAPLPFKLAKGPDVMDLVVIVSPPAEDGSNSVTVTAKATDNEMTELDHTDADVDTNPESGTNDIARVDAFFDGHPYDAPTPGSMLMQPDDGNFDAPTERVTLTLYTSNLTVGQHMVCLEATDVAGYTGPVSCRYFVVPPAPVPTTLAPATSTVDVFDCKSIQDEEQCTINSECHWKRGKSKCVDLCQGRSNLDNCQGGGNEGKCKWDSTENTCYRITR